MLVGNSTDFQVGSTNSMWIASCAQVNAISPLPEVNKTNAHTHPTAGCANDFLVPTPSGNTPTLGRTMVPGDLDLFNHDGDAIGLSKDVWFHVSALAVGVIVPSFNSDACT
jgi:hypothetical protein